MLCASQLGLAPPVRLIILGHSMPIMASILTVTENMKALDVYRRMKKDATIFEKVEALLGNKPARTELFGRWA